MSKKRTAKNRSHSSHADAEWAKMILARLGALAGEMDPEEELMRELDLEIERRQRAREARIRKLEDLFRQRDQLSAHAEPTKDPRNR